MGTKKQVNQVLMRCKGGAHHKDLNYKKEQQRLKDYYDSLKRIGHTSSHD